MRSLEPKSLSRRCPRRCFLAQPPAADLTPMLRRRKLAVGHLNLTAATLAEPWPLSFDASVAAHARLHASERSRMDCPGYLCSISPSLSCTRRQGCDRSRLVMWMPPSHIRSQTATAAACCLVASTTTAGRGVADTRAQAMFAIQRQAAVARAARVTSRIRVSPFALLSHRGIARSGRSGDAAPRTGWAAYFQGSDCEADREYHANVCSKIFFYHQPKIYLGNNAAWVVYDDVFHLAERMPRMVDGGLPATGVGNES